MNYIQDANKLFEEILKRIENEGDMENFYNYLHSYKEQQESKTKKRDMIQYVADDYIENTIVYYSKPSKIYFYNFNNNFILSNEDNILHSIHEYISENKFDNAINNGNMEISLKNAIKSKIIKYVKEKCSIYENIPESETIQCVVDGLTPAIFPNRVYAKLFLVILGDILLKKYNAQGRPIIFIRSCLKDFIQELNKYANVYFSHIGYTSYFKHKFNEEYHKDSLCYVLPCNNINMDCMNYSSQFKINLICVSIYFSNRYENATEFIRTLDDNSTEYSNILYLQNLDKNDIYNEFITKYLQKTNLETDETDACVREKDLIFLWKKYNEDIDRVANGFSSVNEFVQGLYRHCGQVDNNGKLLGYVNRYQKQIQCFKEFWTTHFSYDESEYYFEIEEILHLFKSQYPDMKKNINDMFIRNIINLNYNQYDIINNKVIHNLKCNLWDKKNEVQQFLSSHSIIISKKNNNSNKQNYNLLYTKYLRHSKNTSSIKISKKYFKKYIEELV